MYPDLSYLFHDLFGSPVDNWTSIFKTFGLFLVLAILSAALILRNALKKMAEEGVFSPRHVKITIGKGSSWLDLAANAFWGFILGFKGVYAFQHLEALKSDAAEVLLSTKGNWLAGLGLALAAAAYRYWQGKKEQLPQPKEVTKEVFPHDQIGDITMIAAISGVIGAKLFAVIEDIPALLRDPAGVLLSGGGLAIYGGQIVGFIVVTWYLRRQNIPIMPVLDAVAPALMVSYGVGRLGCHFSGDGDWGIPAAPQPSWWFLPDWFWAYDYPHNVIDEGARLADCTSRYCMHLESPVYTTSIYEFLAAIAIGGILLALRKRLKTPGMLFFIYLMFNGFERFWIEKIRVNSKYTQFGITYTQAEFIAVVLFLIGLGGFIYLYRKGRGESAAPIQAAPKDKP